MNKDNEIKPIYLIGICDRFNQPVIGHLQNGSAITRIDIIGLKTFYGSVVFPFVGQHVHFVLLIDNEYVNKQGEAAKLNVFISDSDGGEVGNIEITAQAYRISGPGGGEEDFLSRFTLSAVSIPDAVFFRPGTYVADVEIDGNRYRAGSFIMAHTPALPLTEERIRAIKSDPEAVKGVLFELSCKQCGATLKTEAKLERSAAKTEYIWYEDLENSYECECGKVKFDLVYLRENLHGLLGRKQSPLTLEAGLERQYTSGALRKISDDFWKVIGAEKTETKILEQVVQEYMEQNPLTLAMFSPQLIKKKAPATAAYRTDFVIYDNSKRLVLVEIERPGLRLFTKSGQVAAPLTHAFGQVEDWLMRARRNRLGLIDDLGMKGFGIDDVQGIRGVVIAGRSRVENGPQMEKLHGRNDIDFFTYDDLYKFLRNITAKLIEV